MRVLHAIFSMTTGGSETMLVDILNQQCAEVPTGLLIVNNKVNESLLATIDRRVALFPIRRQESNKPQLLTACRKIAQVIRKFKPDVIHCHDNKLLPFFFFQRRKTCLTVHRMHISMLFMKHFAQRFSVSEAVREDVEQCTGCRSTVVYNGIEIAKYQMRTGATLLPDEEFKIIQISRLKPNDKGQPVAIEALKRLREQFPDMRASLSLVGGGDGLDLLQQLSVGERVTFLGERDRSWIQSHLKDFHLLIQPSFIEGFGLTLVEGFAAGLPVVASDIKGPREVLTLLQAGLTAKKGSVEDLAAKIRIVYEHYLSSGGHPTAGWLTDRNRLELFNVRTTAANYLREYAAMTSL